MSTYVTAHVARPVRRDAYYDWLQMLTGLGLVLFMGAHMVLVSSVIIAPGVMNAIAEFFESTYMAQVGGPLIFLVFLVHFVLAARKIPFRFEGQRLVSDHAMMLKHRDTWLWVVQAVTAMIILVMGSIHMWVVLSDLPITAQKSALKLDSGSWLLFDLVLLLMVWLHLVVGLYRIGVKWGFIRRENRSKSIKLAYGLFAVCMTIGLLTVIRFATLATVAVE